MIIEESVDRGVDLQPEYKNHFGQLALMIGCLFCIGGLFGLERTLLALMAGPVWGEQSSVTVTSIVISFGLSKAIANGVAGMISDKFGRKIVVIIGMVIAIPVPVIIIMAPSWRYVTLANFGLGASQGLAASSIVLMLIDILGKSRSGIAVGILECSIYVSMAIWSFLGVQISVVFGYQPIPFTVGAIIAIIGALLSLMIKDTLSLIYSHNNNEEIEVDDSLKEVDIDNIHDWLSNERTWVCFSAKNAIDENNTFTPSEAAFISTGGSGIVTNTILGCIFNKQISLSTIAGIVNNVKDGMAWVVLPLYFSQDWSVDEWMIGILTFVYPITWGITQLFTAAASDKYGRKSFLVGGLLLQGISLLLLLAIPHMFKYSSYRVAFWFYSLLLLGLGTALIYPVIQAAVSDELPPEKRGTGLGVYRFCRDMGYVIGAVLSYFLPVKSFIILLSAIMLLSCSIAIYFFFVSKSSEK